MLKSEKFCLPNFSAEINKKNHYPSFSFLPSGKRICSEFCQQALMFDQNDFLSGSIITKLSYSHRKS